jgi:hypothetical protein
VRAAAKELHFNRNMEALKKMQAGADKLATVVGVTLGPKVGRATDSRSGGDLAGCRRPVQAGAGRQRPALAAAQYVQVVRQAMQGGSGARRQHARCRRQRGPCGAPSMGSDAAARPHATQPLRP